jgi:integrase/recombinase XerD
VTRAPRPARAKIGAGALPPHSRQGGAGQGSDGASRWNAGGGRAGPGPGIRKATTLPAHAAGIRLYTADGARKYVTAGERDAFLREAERADRQVRTLCMTLAYAGCRLSEALAITVDRVDLGAGVLVFATLKKRQPGVFRAVPVPPALLDALDMVHGIRERQARRGKGRGERLWPWSRMTGWRAVHAVMEVVGLDGPQASPKGLRHGSAWRLSPPAFRSTWCRNGSATLSSPPPPSTLTPSGPRKKTLPGRCGDRDKLNRTPCVVPPVALYRTHRRPKWTARSM